MKINEENFVLLEALKELAKECENNYIPPFELNIIGNFALMLYGIKDNKEHVNIDYIGPDLSPKVKELARIIGIKRNLGQNWINNDFILTGSSLEDLEFCTGKLYFTDYYEVGSIKLNILNQSDLLKLKIIAIDTTLFDVESGLPFTRFKDLQDIITLKDKLHINLKKYIQDLDLQGLILNTNTYKIINMYEKNGKKATLDYLENLKQNHELFNYDTHNITNEFLEDVENTEKGYMYE